MNGAKSTKRLAVTLVLAAVIVLVVAGIALASVVQVSDDCWKIDETPPIGSTPYTLGDCEVTIDAYMTDDGMKFDWEITGGDCVVTSVEVKGGPGDPIAFGGGTSGSGLHAPINPNTDKYYDVSHIVFCFQQQETTTTTEAETTTTTEAETTTTTSEVEETTTTTVGEITSTTTTEQVTTTTSEGETTTTAAGLTTVTKIQTGAGAPPGPGAGTWALAAFAVALAAGLGWTALRPVLKRK